MSQNMANNKTKIVIAVIFLFLFTATSVFASGESFPTYEHTPEDLSQLHYLVGTDFTALDTSNQIISENLTVEYLYPLYKKMMGDPVSIKTKNLLYQDYLIDFQP